MWAMASHYLPSQKISQFTQFVSSEAILLIITIILEIASCSSISIATSLCAGQCLLFGKVFERKRIVEGSDKGWCALPMLLHTMAIGSSFIFLLFLFRSIRRGKLGARNSYYKALGLLSVSILLTFLAAVIITRGFQKMCDSFVINRCSHAHFNSMDWKKFTPKYSDCNGVYRLLESAMVCSWCACSLLCLVCLIQTVT